MNFGGLDLTALMQMQGAQGASSSGLPQVKTNMAPPANFWEGNEFKIGAPGMQETPVSSPAHPANPAAPPQTGQQPSMPSNFTPPTSVDPRQEYLDRYPDLMQHYQSQNIASSPHLLGGGGAGTDGDGNGQISPLEWAQYHYNTTGVNEGRNWGAPQQTQTANKKPLPYMSGASNPFLQG